MTLAGWVQGCKRAQVDYAPMVADRPAPLRDAHIRVLREGPANFALNQNRLAYQALELGFLDEAAEALDKSIGTIETVFAADKQAADARGLFSKEASKIYKGEPYERMTVYMLRGLLYQVQGDLSNARACYKSAEIQDAFSAESQNNSDFAAGYLLRGFVNYQMDNGFEGDELFLRACDARPARVLLRDEAVYFGYKDEVGETVSEDILYIGKVNTFVPELEGANTLVVAFTGEAPSKFAWGQYKEKLSYRRIFNPVFSVQVKVDDRPPIIASSDNLYYQAVTRGGRLYDELLKRKATVKGVTTVVGVTTMGVGAGVLAQADDGQEALVGAAIIIGGALITGIAGAMKTEADTRFWEDVPDNIHFLPLQLEPGMHEVDISYRDAVNRSIDVKSVRIEKRADEPMTILALEKAVLHN